MTWSKAALAELKSRIRLDDFVRADGVELVKEGRDLLGICPFHDDSTPSLAVEPDKNGGVYRCRACGEAGDVITWVMKRKNLRFPDAVRDVAATAGFALPEETRTDPAKRKRVALYRYVDADGELLYSIERWEPGRRGRGKDFVQRLASGEAKKSPRQVMYRWPEVAAAVLQGLPVFVVEGEKCADALAELGLAATTNAGGTSCSSVWEDPDFNGPLFGGLVVIVPDNDLPGAKHAEHVAAALTNVAGEIRTLNLPVKGKGADVVDWLKAGGTAEALVEMAREAPVWRASDNAWRAQLSTTANGREIKATPGNALLILENESVLRGLLAWDEHSLRVTVTGRPPWKSFGPYPRAFDDDDVLRAGQWIEASYGVAFNLDTLGRAFYSAARRNPIDPVIDWLRQLRWDGVERIDTWLTNYLGAEDSGLTRELGARWLISAVARATKPGCKVDHVLVLEGPQGARKSSALRVLGGAWYSDGLESMEGKDALMSIGLAWIVEIPELDAMSKHEVSRVKAFITRQVDRYRPPYGRTTKEAPRRCVFAGTTNEDAYLQDATGNRRFWPVKCGRIDINQLSEDRVQLWAEARVRLDNGERWWLESPALEEALRREQDDRMHTDPWEAAIAIWADGRDSVTTGDALNAVGVERQQRHRGHAMRVAAVFKRLGFTRRKRLGGRANREWHYFKAPENQAVRVPPSEVGHGGGTPNPEQEQGGVPSVPVSDLPRARMRVHDAGDAHEHALIRTGTGGTLGHLGHGGGNKGESVSDHVSQEKSGGTRAGQQKADQQSFGETELTDEEFPW